jgi:hypothetical protein
MGVTEPILNQYLKGQLKFSFFESITDQNLFDLVQKIGIRNQNLVVVLEELIINSREHGGGASRFYYDQHSSNLTFVIVDKGGGIHEKVPMNPRLSDTKGIASASIIRLSLEEGITGTGQVGRGMGLYYFSQLIKNCNAEGLVASDKGCVVQKGDEFFEKDLTQDTKATILILQIGVKEAGL